MHLKCMVCDARYYSASGAQVGHRCGVAGCTGVLVLARGSGLTRIK